MNGDIHSLNYIFTSQIKQSGLAPQIALFVLHLNTKNLLLLATCTHLYNSLSTHTHTHSDMQVNTTQHNTTKQQSAFNKIAAE